MATETLRITAFKATNIRKGDEIELKPGRINVFSGKNAQGKTTVQAAMKAAIEGGNLAKQATVRGGEAQAPEVFMTLGNDTDPEIYRVNKVPAKLTVEKRVPGTAAYKAVQQPQGFLDAIVDGLGLDPVRLALTPQKDLSTAILEALPLESATARLKEIVGEHIELVTGAPILAKLHPLLEVEAYRKAIYDGRTGVNRDAKQAFSAAEQLRLKLPPKIEDVSAEQIKAVEAQKDALAEALSADKEKARSECDEKLKAAATERDAEVAKVRADFAAFAAEKRRAVEEEIAKEAEVVAESERASNITFEATRADANKAYQEATAELAEREQAVNDLKAHVAGLHEKAKTVEAQNALHKQAQEFDAQAEVEKAKSATLSAIIDKIEALKMQLASALPIPGLSISPEGEITVNGTPWDQVNTAARLDVLVRICVLRAKGPLRAIFIDNSEAMDSENFEALKARLAAENIQVFAGRVTDQPGLNVETIPWS